MSVGGLIVGAGESRRAGFDKVFASLAGLPVLAHSLRTFVESPEIDRVVLVLSATNADQGRRLVAEGEWAKPVDVCLGGRRRQDSVAFGLAELADCDWVVVHDAARPLVTPQLIARGLQAAAAGGAAIAAVPVTDTIKLVGPTRLVRATPPRADLWSVQTPQVFRYRLLVDAYAGAKDDFTDDAGLLEQLGQPVAVFEGSYDNIKITHAHDLTLAEALLTLRGG
ncbi:MAG: 2-C-methyl-D-erythritol 4-phosphate cytidylyltransferase [Chloroflexi bacterium]|nr:2-C-methyl-D-erythritol 4-phosphate cytidylyltransferase [Chloroflexota bacterium]MCL5110990.1 2-C-methyl-D-erythritol 4-phosphate cytidylyltransferase [Chloroflexota bacterium]